MKPSEVHPCHQCGKPGLTGKKVYCETCLKERVKDSQADYLARKRAGVLSPPVEKRTTTTFTLKNSNLAWLNRKKRATASKSLCSCLENIIEALKKIDPCK
jgi:hypothetical protein